MDYKAAWYKAAWEDLQRELKATIATYERVTAMLPLSQEGAGEDEGYKNVAAWMKHAEKRAAKPDADADAKA